MLRLLINALVVSIALICFVIDSPSARANSEGSTAGRNDHTKVDFDQTFSDAAKGALSSSPRTREKLRDAGWRSLTSASEGTRRPPSSATMAEDHDRKLPLSVGIHPTMPASSLATR